MVYDISDDRPYSGADYDAECVRASSLHRRLALETERFIEDLESTIMVTYSTEPCSLIPKIAVVESPEWDVWKVHKRARSLWLILTEWNRWHVADGIGPPKLFETEAPGGRITHLFRVLIQRWGWRSVLERDSLPLGKEHEPPGEVTGRETITAAELQGLKIACSEFRAIVGSDHDPRFADRQPDATTRAQPPLGDGKTFTAPAMVKTIPPPSDATAEYRSHALNDESQKVRRDHVFISYSHPDKRFLDALVTHLKPYLRAGAIDFWSDEQIKPGSKWFDEIRSALAITSVAVLLVTPSFLASDFIHEHELGPLLKEAETGGVKILWVLVRDCSYKETSLKDYQAVVAPPDKALALMKAERDTAWKRVCEEIKRAANCA